MEDAKVITDLLHTHIIIISASSALIMVTRIGSSILLWDCFHLWLFVVIILKLNILSSHLNGAIFMMQLLTSPILMHLYDGILQTNVSEPYQIIGVKIVYVILGMFNLDFLCDIYPNFCLHPSLNILTLESLDYIIAIIISFLPHHINIHSDKNL